MDPSHDELTTYLTSTGLRTKPNCAWHWCSSQLPMGHNRGNHSPTKFVPLNLKSKFENLGCQTFWPRPSRPGIGLSIRFGNPCLTAMCLRHRPCIGLAGRAACDCRSHLLPTMARLHWVPSLQNRIPAIRFKGKNCSLCQVGWVSSCNLKFFDPFCYSPTGW